MNPSLKILIKETSQLLKSRNLLLATAESCTGGGLAFYLTEMSGASEWYERGFVVYSNEAKKEMLGVKASTLEKFGAVSEETAREMAEGVLTHSHADISVAITGVAGPSGGSKEKPVGIVWFAWAMKNIFVRSQVKIFEGDRSFIREQAMEYALKELAGWIKHFVP